MKIVNCFINLIMIPLGMLLFVMMGILSAVISAGIEYSVVYRLFLSVNIEHTVTVGIALLIVLVFEYAKIFLHFYEKKKMQDIVSTKGDSSKYLSGTKLMMLMLVLFSFICSVMFTLSTLYMPTYDKTLIEEEVLRIEENLENDIKEIEEKYKTEYENAMKSYSDSISNIENSIDGYTGDITGPKTATAYFDGMENLLEDAKDNYVQAESRLSKERDKKINKDKAELQAKAKQEIEKLRNAADLDIVSEYDNVIIADFLSVLANVFYGVNTYGRKAYLVICVLFGVLIAALLEAVISLSMQFLSVPKEFLTEEMKDVSEKIHNGCSELVFTTFKAFCAVAVYIAILSFSSIAMEKRELYMGLISCAIANFLVQKYVPIPENKKGKEHLLYQVRDCVLQGIISLMGFVLMGFLFGEEAMSIDMNTIAVGIGASVSGGIIQFPHVLMHMDDGKSC